MTIEHAHAGQPNCGCDWWEDDSIVRELERRERSRQRSVEESRRRFIAERDYKGRV